MYNVYYYTQKIHYFIINYNALHQNYVKFLNSSRSAIHSANGCGDGITTIIYIIFCTNIIIYGTL